MNPSLDPLNNFWVKQFIVDFYLPLNSVFGYFVITQVDCLDRWTKISNSICTILSL